MKRIVLCCDGTWNRADHRRNGVPCPTNVARISYLIAKESADGIPQIVSYDEGVGTGNSLDRLTGGAFGRGLDGNIFEAYRFLIANYELGDEIYLFGFSRGAFTVRSIAGMIRKCGILRRATVQHYHEALTMYRDAQRPDDDGPKAFRAANSVAADGEIPITFIGVWDTVGSLGIPLRGLRWITRRKYQFHDTELSGTVKNAYQALAIDEHRDPFLPTLWSYKPKPGQTIEQVWFTGVHSDVGGGFAERELSDIALMWMLEKAQSVGLWVDKEALDTHLPRPDPFGKLHRQSRLLTRLPLLGADRTIGMATPAPGAVEEPGLDPTQSIHPAALQRWDGDPTYRPEPLRRYFRLTGDPRADA